MKNINNSLQQLLQTAYLDFEFGYKVPSKFLPDNACRVRLFDKQQNNLAINSQVIILTELKGRGMSVTNSVEFIIPQLEYYLLTEKAIVIRTDCIYIEHYDQDSYYDSSQKETFDRVMLLNSRPGWSRLSTDEIFLYLN